MAKNTPKTASKEKKAPRAKLAPFTPLKFKDHTITQKKSGRFAVVTAKGKSVLAAEKVKLLIEAKLLKGSFKKAAAEETAAN